MSADIEPLQADLKDKNPRKILKSALENFDNIAIAFSGAEDVVVIDLAVNIRKDIPVFCLDTGRLHPETYRFIEKVRSHYGIVIEMLSPDYRDLDNFVKAKGLFSFYQDGHQECCAIRKSRTVTTQTSTSRRLDHRTAQRPKLRYPPGSTRSRNRQHLLDTGTYANQI